MRVGFGPGRIAGDRLLKVRDGGLGIAVLPLDLGQSEPCLVISGIRRE